jgi:RNA polymerase sigma-70 factor, ECF subfamily
MEMTGPPPSNDDDLLRRLREGDEAALAALYGRWQAPVFRLALRLSGSREVAEDVAQEVFLALMRGVSGYDPARGPLSSYLFGMARNQVLRRIERERPYVALEPEDEDDVREDPAGSFADPLDSLVRQEDVERVREAVLSLPLHYREAVVLCDLQLLSYEEAASVLACALGTVRSRLARGRELLAAKLLRRASGPAPARSVGSAS